MPKTSSKAEMSSQSSGTNNLSTGTSDSSSIYIVNLLKRENEGFGFLVRQRDQKPYFSIWEIIKNGAAEHCGKMKRGDIIIKVNNHDLANASYDHGLDILKSVKSGSVAEFVMQTGSKSDIDLMARYDKAMINANSNGFMSPLQKIKKKFASCTSNHTNSPNVNTSKHLPHNGDSINGPGNGPHPDVFDSSSKMSNGRLKSETSSALSFNGSIPNSPIFAKVERNCVSQQENSAPPSKSPDLYQQRKLDSGVKVNGISETLIPKATNRRATSPSMPVSPVSESSEKKSLQTSIKTNGSNLAEEGATVHRIPVQHIRHQQHFNLQPSSVLKKSTDASSICSQSYHAPSAAVGQVQQRVLHHRNEKEKLNNDHHLKHSTSGNHLGIIPIRVTKSFSSFLIKKQKFIHLNRLIIM
jgi:hypothetical protein